MYDLNDEELEKYYRNNIFRQSCEHAYRNGFTKEQMLSKLAIMLLDMKEESDNQKLQEIMMSTKPHFLLNQ